MSQQKSIKLTLRSTHFGNMSITFSTSNVLDNSYLSLGLNVKGDDAMPLSSIDRPRHVAITYNHHTGGLTLSDSRGAVSSRMLKSIALPSGAYTILRNEIQDGDIGFMSLSSNGPLQILSASGHNGYLLADAHKETLVLAKRKLWFVEKVVNEVEVRVPNCRSNTTVTSPIELCRWSECRIGTESDDEEVVGVQLKEKAKEEIVESRQVDRQDVPDDWVDATD